MSDHRQSYQKTVLLATGLAGGGLLLVAWMVATGWTEAWSWGAKVAWGAACLLVALVVAWLMLVTAGGLLSLHRDTLEAQGVPYARAEPREWQIGWLGRIASRAVRAVTRIMSSRPGHLALRPGELVEVRSLEQILATLDNAGTLDLLPFMPEMSSFCGRQFRVLRRVEKIHDYVHLTGLRRMHDTVLLEGLRCDGGCHGGCQASCHLLWKEAWLRRAAAERGRRVEAQAREAPQRVSGPPRVRETDLLRLTQRADEAGQVSYHCQMTEVARGTTPLKRGDPRHYVRDLILGNVRPGPLLEGVAIALFNWAQKLRGGAGYPAWYAPDRRTSPHQVLNLQPGELVRVKTKQQIAETLTSGSRNRGLWFDAEMVRYCGGEYRVSARVERMIEEKSGKLITITNPCIILEGVTATGEYLAFCPQNESIFWREIWLERTQPRTADS